MDTLKARKIAGQVACGELTMTEIAKKNGMSRENLYATYLRKPKVQEMIERERGKFLKVLPKARKNIENLVKNYDTYDPEGRESQRSYEASMEILKGAGMLPGKPPSVMIQNNWKTNAAVISPEVGDILSRFGMVLSGEKTYKEIEYGEGEIEVEHEESR